MLLELAGLLGYSAAKDLAAEIAARGKTWSKKRLADHMARVKTFAYDAAIARILAQYYSRSNACADLKRYRAVIDGSKKETTIFTTSTWTPLGRPPSEVDFKFVHSADKPDIPASVTKFAPTAMARLDELAVQVTDDPVYRLTSARLTGSESSFHFGRVSFSQYRYTAGLLEDELKDSLAFHDGNMDAILRDSSKTLPIRSAVLPNVNSFTQYSRRISIGGPGVVFAMARGKPHNDFVLPIQTRSQRVADGQGRLAVVPKACHQDLVDPNEEVGLQWTIYRELYEEIFGGQDAERRGRSFSHDWYFDLPPLRYFREHEGAFKNEITGFGLNAVSGNYEFAILLAVLDTWYLSAFKGRMKPMWEAESIEPVSTRDARRIADLLLTGNWALESVFHLVEGLIRLREIAPERVNLPDLCRELVTD